MPPKRRASGPATKSSQSTLAFHGASNKVTKPNTRTPSGKKKVLSEVAKKIEAKPEIIELIDEPTTAEAALIDQTKDEVVEVQRAQSTPEEDDARRISDAAIKQYWASKEKLRTAPRVHQQDLSLHEKILREFDMSAQYGVSPLLSESHTDIQIKACLYCAYADQVVLLAMHWDCSIEALEACAPYQAQPSARGPRRAVEGDGQRQQGGASTVTSR
jgi:DNA polymerase delta subunit 4